jgi:RecG-like helicase
VDVHSEHSRNASSGTLTKTVEKPPYINFAESNTESPILTDEPISHYAEDIYPIGSAVWRKRAHIRGRVASIRTAPSGGAPNVEVVVWDQTGGITLQFLGRREIVGLEVGSTICAEGMVGETNGALTILNPSYEIVI